ncbi:putative zinc-type alcohol dehydrogenase-like protein [Halteromyces radiatus]|uniref:putative zinc-type alcohol dehydrogenase-like protein n=1 Tax=Halteromyces radiatus TaxID=101107 RepID=UPI0022203AE1|nr:putative zinc-type alcohol dehydrogenase-like protein [Halteromyces radiatus]KAI8096440.1 putative zinc-type alcohol dehydrogenase-like protein [Halteromyces radiatus]
MSKQIVYRNSGNKSYKDIKSREEPIPDIDGHEVLIKIKAVTLNYRDLVIADGSYPGPVKANYVPCSDGAGEVIKVGSSVQNVKVGDRVVIPFYPTNFYGVSKNVGNGTGAVVDGVLQQYKTVLGESVVKIPDDTHLSYGEAASLVCTGVTAWNSLYGAIRFTAGQSVLLLGTGGVSITTLVLARAAGAVTIITSSSDEKLKYVKEKYGVDYTINYKTHPDWEKEVLRLTKGEGVDFVIENGGAGTIAKSIASIKRGGQIAIVGFLAQPTEMPNVTSLVLSKSCSIRGISVGSKQQMEELVQFVHVKKLHMPVEKEFDFSDDQVQAAFQYLGSGAHVGKVIINVD